MYTYIYIYIYIYGVSFRCVVMELCPGRRRVSCGWMSLGRDVCDVCSVCVAFRHYGIYKEFHSKRKSSQGGLKQDTYRKVVLRGVLGERAGGVPARPVLQLDICGVLG